MFIKRKRRQVPSLNTTATADISFMLLVFFLVTTSLDIDKGLTRQLPPPDDKEAAEMPVDRGHVLALQITATDTLLCDGKPADVSGLRKRVADFVLREGEKHLITVEARPEAHYDTYFRMQNQIVAAYRDVRDTRARAKFGKPYAQCSADEQEMVRTLCPQRVAENYAANQAPGAQEGGPK